MDEHGEPAGVVTPTEGEGEHPGEHRALPGEPGAGPAVEPAEPSRSGEEGGASGGVQAAREALARLLGEFEADLAALPAGAAGLGHPAPDHHEPGPQPARETGRLLRAISAPFHRADAAATAARDLYGRLAEILARHGTEAAPLVARHAEAAAADLADRLSGVRRRLTGLLPELPALLERAQRTGRSVRQGRGWTLAEWQALQDWCTGDPQAAPQSQDPVLCALHALLRCAAGTLRPGGAAADRRQDLLRLARWFDRAGSEEAHDLFTAAFGLYGARHLGVSQEPQAGVPAYTSWWHGPTAPVPVGLRERGPRPARSRAVTAPDAPEPRRQPGETAQEGPADPADPARRAATELRRAFAGPAGPELSPPAAALLLDLLAAALGNARLRRDAYGYGLDGARAARPDLGVRLAVERRDGARAQVRCAADTLEVPGLLLTVAGTEAVVPAREVQGA